MEQPGGASIVGNTTIATTAGNTLSLGNSTGTLTVTGSSASSFVLNGVTVSATSFNLLSGKDTALVDTTDAVTTAITGTGALGSGTIGTGFGVINTGDTISGSRLLSTVATGTAPLTVTSTTQVANLNVEYLAGYRENQLAQSLRSANQITGGGNVTYNGAGVGWTTRFIVISNGNGADFSTGGYYDMDMPANGTVITGVGGAANVTVAGGIIPMSAWNALYYILPIGGSFSTNNANYRIANYTSALQVPSNWVLIAIQNPESGVLKLSTGVSLRSGQTTTSGSINNAIFNTSVSSPQLIATVATGTAPLAVTSTTQVNNLNVQYLGGIQASQFVRSDADDTTTGRLVFSGTSNGQAFNQAPIEILETFSGGAGLAPRLSFHYGGSVASQIGFIQGDSSGDIAAINNPGTGYEDFRAATYMIQGTTVIDGSRNIVNAGSGSFSGNITTSGVLVAASSLQFGGSAAIGFYNDGTNIAIRGNNNGTSGIFLQGQGGATTPLYAGIAGTHINRVGIATTTPGYTLDVNGAVNTNSSYKINGVDICTSSGCTASGGASLTANNIFTGLNTFQNAVDITGNVSIGDILTVGQSAGRQIVIASGATNHNIELGRTDGVASSPYIDFHAGSSAVDHDVRLIASSGNGTVSGGQLVIQAREVQIGQKLMIPNLGFTNGGANYVCWISATGELTRASACSNSSIRYKENIVALDDTLDLLGQLRPVSFDWKANTGLMASDGGLSDYGFIAEEVNEIIPGLVTRGENGQIEGLNYALFAPFLVRAIQQQQSQITMLQQSANIVNGGSINGSLAITESLNVSGATTLNSLTVTGDATIQGNLTVLGDITTTNLTVNGHIITGGEAPEVSIETQYNESNVQVAISGNDTTGKVVITTNDQSLFADPNWVNTINLEDGVMLLSLAFDKEFGANPKVLLSASNANAARLGAFASGETKDGFKLFITELPTGNKSYEFTYWVAE